MASAWVIGNSDESTGIRWTPMLALSVVFHICVFSIILFVPGAIPSGRVKGIVYEVNLVEMPAGVDFENRGTKKTTVERKGKTVAKRATQAKRIPTREKAKKPLVVAKRTVKKRKSQAKKPRISSSRLIDKAISRIEKKVKSEGSNNSHVEKAITELEKKVGGRSLGAGGLAGGGSLDGLPMRIYQMEVENWIKGNWSYPVAAKDQKKLEAVVLLKVKENGTIMELSFTRRSKDAIFDESVLKAIEKSDPLPPFPEGYRKSYEEFEINFNLKDLEDD